MAQSTARNALSASLQMAVTTGAGLFYFGYLMRSVGPEAMGSWLAWLALAMVACLADLGLRESLVRRVALARTAGDEQSVIALIDSTVVAVAALMALGLGLLLLLAPRWLDLGAARDTSWAVILGVAVMVWLQRVVDVHAAALEGLQRYDLVARNNVLGAVAGIATLLVAVPMFGVRAASLGLIVQYGAAGAAHLGVLRRQVPARRWWPQNCQPKLVRQGLAYGLSVQSATGSFLLIESLTKVMLARAGALSLLAYFDLAFRIGRGLRNLLVAGNRVLVPRLASVHARAAEPQADGDDAAAQLRSMYVSSFQLVVLLAIPLFALAMSGASLASMLTRAQVDPAFVAAFVLTMPPWFVLCAVDPVINASMGAGAMRPIVLAHVAMLALLAAMTAAVQLALHLQPGWRPLGGTLALISTALAIGLPCAALLWDHHRRHGLPIGELAPWRSLIVALLSMALGASVNLMDPTPQAQLLGVVGAALAIALLLRALPGWSRVTKFIRRRQSKAST